MRSGPLTDLHIAQFPVKRIDHHFKLRAKQSRMLSHMFMQAVQILEEPHVAQLIQFIVTDGLNRHIFPEIVQVRLRSCHRRDTGTREADF